MKWGKHYLVGGRKLFRDRDPKTTLYWLINGKLHETAQLPSAGDNSYPGFVPINDITGLLSYYSTPEGRGESLTSIYLAELELEPHAPSRWKRHAA